MLIRDVKMGHCYHYGDKVVQILSVRTTTNRKPTGVPTSFNAGNCRTGRLVTIHVNMGGDFPSDDYEISTVNLRPIINPVFEDYGYRWKTQEEEHKLRLYAGEPTE